MMVVNFRDISKAKMPNKLFKRDSQRLPFLVLIIGFSVYAGMVKLGGALLTP